MEGHQWCAAIDLASFFDEIPHDLVRSERAANRVLDGISRYLEKELRLPVNRDKSQAALVKDVAFVGFKILRGKIRVSDKAREKFRDRVRQQTRRKNPLSMYQIIQNLNEYLRGWVGYFGIQEFKKPFVDLDGWTRSRLRSMQLKKWKNPMKFQRMMIHAGYKHDKARRTWVKMTKWQSVKRREVRFAMNLKWFRQQGLVFLEAFVQRQKPLEMQFTR